MTLSRRSFGKLLAGAAAILPLSLLPKPNTDVPAPASKHPLAWTGNSTATQWNHVMTENEFRRLYEGDWGEGIEPLHIERPVVGEIGQYAVWKFYGGYSVYTPDYKVTVTP